MWNIFSLIGTLTVFAALIIFGPQSKTCKWLFPAGVLFTAIGIVIKREWMGLVFYGIVYGFIYLLFIKRKKKV